MKRLTVYSIVALVLFFASIRMVRAQAQTTVTATVTDPNGVPYAGGTVKAQINPPGPPSPCVVTGGNCVPIQGTVGPQPLDSTGSFTMNLYPNASITPAATTWIFTVCISPGVPPPFGTGPQCFSSTATIAGASQSLSSALSAAAPMLSHSAAAAVWSTLALGGTNTGTGMVLAPTATSGGALSIISPASYSGLLFSVSQPLDGNAHISIGNTTFGTGGGGGGFLSTNFVTSSQFFSGGGVLIC